MIVSKIPSRADHISYPWYKIVTQWCKALQGCDTLGFAFALFDLGHLSALGTAFEELGRQQKKKKDGKLSALWIEANLVRLLLLCFLLSS